jgi:hypothetical protein
MHHYYYIVPKGKKDKRNLRGGERHFVQETNILSDGKCLHENRVTSSPGKH